MSVTTNAGVSLGPVLAELLITELIEGTPTDLLEPYRSTRFADYGNSSHADLPLRTEQPMRTEQR